jgi:phenylalanyl-tRNA synthetase alpha chain
MGCGMVHPNVLKSANIDPNEYQGFAFGFGLTRLLMMKHKITDIRHIHSGDLRFLQQFQ